MRTIISRTCLFVALNVYIVFAHVVDLRDLDALNSPNPRDFDLAARGLGLNCQGSFWCAKKYRSVFHLWNDNIPPSRLYVNGEHIACDGNICAFLQYTQDNQHFSGGIIHKLVEFLYAHGCITCGSIPTGYPYSNDPAQDGILTINYVQTPNCSGPCEYGSTPDLKNPFA